MSLVWKPRKSAGLLSAVVGDEIVVYDVRSESAHALNPVAALLWERSDGSRTLQELEAECAATCKPEWVRPALLELAAKGLLEAPPHGSESLNRRRLLRGLAYAAPLLSTIVMPLPSDAASGGDPPKKVDDPGSDPDPDTPLAYGAVGGAFIPALFFLAGCREKWRYLELWPFGTLPLEAVSLSLLKPQGNEPPPKEKKMTLGDIPFRIIPTAVLLNGPAPAVFPEEACSIPVEHKFEFLYLLHSARGEPLPEGELIARYRVNYADGDHAVIPVEAGIDVNVPEGKTDDSDRGQLVWEDESGQKLYLSTWKNPRPDVEVFHIDYSSERRAQQPYCVAITTGSCVGRRRERRHEA